jgi:hypothetical protein
MEGMVINVAMMVYLFSISTFAIAAKVEPKG